MAMGGYAGGEIKLAVPPARATPVTPHARPDTFPPCRRFTRPISLRRAFFALPTAQAAPHLLAQTLLGLTPSTRPMPRRVPQVLTTEGTIEPGFCHLPLHHGVHCDYFIEEKGQPLPPDPLAPEAPHLSPEVFSRALAGGCPKNYWSHRLREANGDRDQLAARHLCAA